MIYFEETIFDSQENDEICFSCKVDLDNSSKYRNFKRRGNNSLWF